MAAKAESWKGYNEAAITDRVLEILPELAAAVSAPLARTDKIVMIGGNGSSPGASKITGDVTQVMAQMPAVLEALTGLRLDELAKRVPGVKGSESKGSDPDAVDGDAEELR